MNPDIASIPLRDIHLPEPVSWWPLAPGWWITLGLLVLAAVVGYLLKLARERQQLTKQSLDEFTRLVSRYQADRDARSLLSDISQLIRRVSITQFEHESIAGLTGDAWLEFLDRTMESKKNGRDIKFCGELGAYLVAAQYQKSSSIDEHKLDQLLVLSKAWLQLVCNKQPAYMNKGSISKGINRYSEASN